MDITEKKGFIKENDRMEKKEIEPDGHADIAVSLDFFQLHEGKLTRGIFCKGVL